MMQKYGPPGFGEHPDSDSKVSVPILVLSHPVDVCGDPTSDVNRDTIPNVKEVQLSALGDRIILPYVGQDVVATGRLFEAGTANHYTRVLLHVTRIESAYHRVEGALPPWCIHAPA